MVPACLRYPSSPKFVEADAYKGRSFVQSRADLKLLRTHSEEKLDVVETRNGIFLRKMDIFERIVNWFFGWNSQRYARLEAYKNQAVASAQTVNEDLNYIPTFQFFSAIRKWEKIPSDERVTEIIRSALRHNLKKANREYHSKRDEWHTPKSEISRAFWERQVAESLYAEELGQKAEKATSGVNGTHFGMSLNKAKITVIKPNAKDPRVFNEDSTLILRSQGKVCNHDPRQAEAVAFQASEFFDFDIVPATYTDEDGVSIQLFTPNAVPSNDREAQIREREDFDADELEHLQLMAIFNYFSGDLDGKDDNWLVQVEDGKVVGIVKIDNGSSFPDLPLSKIRDWWTLKKTYAWKNHKWAKKPLNIRPGSRIEHVLKLITDERKMIEFQVHVQTMYPEFWTQNRINLMRERIATIRAIHTSYQPLSLLAEIYSKEFWEKHEGLPVSGLRSLQEDYFKFNELQPDLRDDSDDEKYPDIPEEVVGDVAQRLMVAHALEEDEKKEAVSETVPLALPAPPVQSSGGILSTAKWAVTAPFGWAKDRAVSVAARFVPMGSGF